MSFRFTLIYEEYSPAGNEVDHTAIYEESFELEMNRNNLAGARVWCEAYIDEHNQQIFVNPWKLIDVVAESERKTGT